jgi:hypothetical protein
VDILSIIKAIIVYGCSLTIGIVGGCILNDLLDSMTDSPDKVMLSVVLLAIGVIGFIYETADLLGIFRSSNQL